MLCAVTERGVTWIRNAGPVSAARDAADRLFGRGMRSARLRTDRRAELDRAVRGEPQRMHCYRRFSKSGSILHVFILFKLLSPIQRVEAFYCFESARERAVVCLDSALYYRRRYTMWPKFSWKVCGATYKTSSKQIGHVHSLEQFLSILYWLQSE